MLKVIGLMSGTSLDGIDAALLETDGESIAKPGPAFTQSYDVATRGVLARALDLARGLPKGARVPAEILEAERVLTERHAQAVLALLDAAELKPADIAYLGFHGQTILHRPKEHWTWQIGDGDGLARATGIAAISDFRARDVEAGGQGAPFVPLYHEVLTRRMTRPIAVVNIGGVANVTFVGADGALLAFDTGPGNAPIDDWALAHTGQPVDRDGALAAAGRVDEGRLAMLLVHPFFAKAPPKSLDRLDFPMDAVKGLSAADGAATLTAFTAETIARARAHMPETPQKWIICGGGRHNPALMAELAKRLAPSRVLSAEQVGWRGDFLEAEAFAYLAMRSVKGLPLSLPSTTGVPRPMPGGTLHRLRA